MFGASGSAGLLAVRRDRDFCGEISLRDIYFGSRWRGSGGKRDDVMETIVAGRSGADFGSGGVIGLLALFRDVGGHRGDGKFWSGDGGGRGSDVQCARVARVVGDFGSGDIGDAAALNFGFARRWARFEVSAELGSAHQPTARRWEVADRFSEAWEARRAESESGAGA